MTSRDTNLRRRTLLQSLGVSAVAGLAGCSGLTNRHYASIPMVLPGEVQTGFGYERVGHDRLVEERQPGIGDIDANLVVESYVFSYDTASRPSVSTEWPRREAPSLLVLATPRVEEAGQQLNPLATRPLDGLLADERGTDLLVRAGILDPEDEDADVEWLAQPQLVDDRTADVSNLEGENTLERYVGIVDETDGPGRAVLVEAVRGTRGSDAVLAAAGEQRVLSQTEGDALSGGDCETIKCLDDQLTFEAFGSIAETIIETVTPCPAFQGVDASRREGVDLDECVNVTGGNRDRMDFLHVDLSNVRVVQQVEDTVVTFVTTSNYSEPDPSLVAGENTAVVFDMETSSASGTALNDWDTDVNVDVERRFAGGRTESDRFQIPNAKAKRIIDGGVDTRAVLHELAANNNSSSPKQPVLFAAETDLESVRVAISMDDDPNLQWSANGDEAVLRAGQNEDFTVTDVRPLRVGFVAFHDATDGDNYGTSQGDVRDYERSVNSAVEYLRRVYPGDLVAYRHTDNTIKASSCGTFCNGNRQILGNMQSANDLLDRVATDPSFPAGGPGFPNGGDLYLHGRNRSQTVSNLKSDGFDVVVAIVPGNDSSNKGATDYYKYYDRPGVSGLAYQDPNAAVSAVGVNPKGSDNGISHTVAQEVGHYFQEDYLNPSGHPMAQRDDESAADSPPTVNNVPIDPAHARHVGSDLRDRDTDGDGTMEVDNPTDIPGVLSTAYDLTDRFTTVEQFTNTDGSFSVTGPKPKATSIGQVPSFMSYTGDNDEVWTDARIHRQLIDGGWSPGGTSGNGSTSFMVSATGRVDEDGTVRYDDVRAFSGVEEYTDLDDGPVTVRLLDPSGEVLSRATVPLEVGVTHGHDTRIEAPSFKLPFHERGVEIRTTVQGRAASMNPVVRSVEDAVARVPTAGVRGEADSARDAVVEPLREVRAAMADGEYGVAATAMDEPVRERIQDVVGEYEAALNEPTRPDLLALVDELVGRLEALAESTG